MSKESPPNIDAIFSAGRELEDSGDSHLYQILLNWQEVNKLESQADPIIIAMTVIGKIRTVLT